MPADPGSRHPTAGPGSHAPLALRGRQGPRGHGCRAARALARFSGQHAAAEGPGAVLRGAGAQRACRTLAAGACRHRAGSHPYDVATATGRKRGPRRRRTAAGVAARAAVRPERRWRGDRHHGQRTRAHRAPPGPHWERRRSGREHLAHYRPGTGTDRRARCVLGLARRCRPRVDSAPQPAGDQSSPRPGGARF